MSLLIRILAVNDELIFRVSPTSSAWVRIAVSTKSVSTAALFTNLAADFSEGRKITGVRKVEHNIGIKCERG